MTLFLPSLCANLRRLNAQLSSRAKCCLALCVIGSTTLPIASWSQSPTRVDSHTDHSMLDSPNLTQEAAANLAELALRCIGQEYPNKLSHVLRDSSDVASPRALYPAFYGCFDWHSSVHGHWMLLRLLREFPELPRRETIREAIGANLQPDKILAEVAYFKAPHHRSFERTYGWAWLLKLSQELHSWDDPQAQQWAIYVQPLAEEIEKLYLDFLPRQTYPIRTGEHPNTAFGLSFAWDYAQALNRTALQSAIRQAALTYYHQDLECPAHYEPSGADFLSPCLEEANLMRRVLSAESFQLWLSSFLPTIPASLREPATVSDRTDGKLVHLDGLNLSRAWCFRGIARQLPDADPRKAQFSEMAEAHLSVTLPQIASGGYEGEHWLGSFAVYALLE